jgi:hypothetical protein
MLDFAVCRQAVSLPCLSFSPRRGRPPKSLPISRVQVTYTDRWVRSLPHVDAIRHQEPYAKPPVAVRRSRIPRRCVDSWHAGFFPGIDLRGRGESFGRAFGSDRLRSGTRLSWCSPRRSATLCSVSFPASHPVPECRNWGSDAASSPARHTLAPSWPSHRFRSLHTSPPWQAIWSCNRQGRHDLRRPHRHELAPEGGSSVP